MGAEALLPLLVSQAGPGPSDVLWFSFVPHSPVSPLFPPPPDSPPTECLVERPRTERLLAIQGGSQGPTQAREAGAVAGAGGLGWAVSSQAKPYLPSAKTVNVYRRRRFLSELQV